MANIYRVLLVVTVLSVAAITASAQGSNLPRRSGLPGVGTIRGRVVTPSGGSISNNVRIRLGDFSTSGVVNYTDSNGEFNFSGLGSGTYYIEVIADANLYDPVTETVNLPPNGRIALTIYLRHKSGVAKKKGDGGALVSVAETDQQVPAAAKKEYERATKLIDQGKAQEAVPHLQQAIALYPDYMMARYNLGVQYLKLKRFTDAAEQLETTIKINPKVFSPRLYMGICLVEQRKYGEAIEQLREAIALDAGQATAHLYMGIAQLGVGDLPTAEGALTKALSLGGDKYSIAHYYLAHLYLKKGERNLALKELNLYLGKTPNGEQSDHARKMIEKLKAN